MPGGIHVDLGLDFLDAATDRVEDAARIGLLRGAEYLKGQTQSRTPVGDTDHLRGGQDVRSLNPDEAAVYVPGPYARFQEYGPHWNPEVLHHEEGMSPYLSTTVMLEGEQVVEIIADAVRHEGGLSDA